MLLSDVVPIRGNRRVKGSGELTKIVLLGTGKDDGVEECRAKTLEWSQSEGRCKLKCLFSKMSLVQRERRVYDVFEQDVAS